MLHGEVGGDERRRARRLHVDRRAAEVEQVARPGGEEVLVVAGVAEQEQADVVDQVGVGQQVEHEVACSCRSRRRRRWRRRSSSGTWPASSSASHAASRKWRCCGSMIAASFGENPKNSASKSARPVERARRPDVPGSEQCCCSESTGRQQLLVGEVANALDAGAQIGPELTRGARPGNRVLRVRRLRCPYCPPWTPFSGDRSWSNTPRPEMSIQATTADRAVERTRPRSAGWRTFAPNRIKPIESGAACRVRIPVVANQGRRRRRPRRR